MHSHNYTTCCLPACLPGRPASRLCCSGVLHWKECLSYPAAWDTLFWFAVLVGMSGQLNSLGVISHFANQVGRSAQNLHRRRWTVPPACPPWEGGSAGGESALGGAQGWVA